MNAKKETRTRQIVTNIEESFFDKYMSLCGQQGISASALARRLIIRHMMESGVLPESVVLDTLL